MTTKNWIAVASAEHARLGRDHRPMGFIAHLRDTEGNEVGLHSLE